jgi:hypothetical protein
MEKLIPWDESNDPELRYFSGAGQYWIDFSLDRKWLQPGRRIYLDLGKLGKIGSVSVNDQSIGGVLWKPPYRVDITDALKKGDNTLVIDVRNTWSNRLVGDARLPREQRVTKTNITYSGKGAWKETPLLPSGLMGPVRLIPAETFVTEP